MKIQEISSKENDSIRELELTSDVTFLLGANGYGKSTSLDAIRKALLADRKKALDLDVTDTNDYWTNRITPTSYFSIKPETIVVEIDMHGKYDHHTLLGFCVGGSELSLSEIISTSEAYSSFILLKLLRKRLEHLEDINFTGNVVVLLDGLDSGTTSDVAVNYARYIRQVIENSNLQLKVIATSNSYEFLNPVEYGQLTTSYLDARSFAPVPVDSYEDFMSFVMKTSSAKDVIVY